MTAALEQAMRWERDRRRLEREVLKWKAAYEAQRRLREVAAARCDELQRAQEPAEGTKR